MFACDKCGGYHSYAFAITKNESLFSFLLTLLCFPLFDTDSDSTRRTEEEDLTGIIRIPSETTRLCVAFGSLCHGKSAGTVCVVFYSC